MRNRWLSLWLSLIVALVTALALPAARAAPGPSSAADVRLVIDVSGSMKDNDPDNLRARSIHLMTDLLPDGTRAGLWTFGQQVTNPLAPGAVDAAWRERAQAILPSLTRYEQFTDLESALEVATDDLGPDSGTTHLIVLTDGMVDIPAVARKAERDRASRQRILQTQAPALAEREIIVHTIALSDNADSALMQRLSGQTGGLAAIAGDANDLLRAFLDVLNQVVPRQQLPLVDGRFLVDDRVRELTALIFHESGEGEVTLRAPDGSRLSAQTPGAASRWRHDPYYDLITVPAPAAGAWQVEGPVGPGSLILIDSSLRLETAPLPARLYQHFPQALEAWLEGPGADVSPTVAVQLAFDEGTIASTPLAQDDDGHFRGTLEGVDRLGGARIDVLARGDGFERLVSRGVTVTPAIDAELDAAQSQIALHALAERLNTDNTHIEAHLLGESLTVEVAGEKRWTVTLPPALPEASVAVGLQARLTLDGETREIVLPPVRLNEGAATGIAGAALDRERIRGEPMPAEKAQAPVEEEDRILQKLWSVAQERWPQIRERGLRLAQDSRAWGVAAVLLFLWLVLALRRRQRRRYRRRTRRARREPRV